MKVMTAALLASAFIASPALACEYGRTADVKMPTHSAAVKMEPTEEAMSTYDPATKPVFESEAQANVPVGEDEATD